MYVSAELAQKIWMAIEELAEIRARMSPLIACASEVEMPGRPAVITTDLVTSLGEFLAFRHLFRGASVALMRWDKLAPLLAKLDSLHRDVAEQMREFERFAGGAA